MPLEMTPWATAAREGSLVAQRGEPVSHTHSYWPAVGAHHVKTMLARQFWQQLKMLQHVLNKRSNLISWVFVNHLHLGSISKCILYIKTHKKLLQSYFLLAHYKIFVSNLHAPTSNDPTEDTSLKCDPLLVLVRNCPPLPAKGLKKIIKKIIYICLGRWVFEGAWHCNTVPQWLLLDATSMRW